MGLLSKFKLLTTLVVYMLLTGVSPSWAQGAYICERSRAECISEANKRRIGLISGSAKGTYIQIADDIRRMLDGFRSPQFPDNEGLRITPMTGPGSVQSVADLLYLHDTDIGLIQADVLLYFIQEFNRTGRYRDVIDNIKYLTKIYSEEVHVVCRRGACGKEFGSVTDIIVNIGPQGSGTALTATLISETLGIPSGNFRNMDYPEALNELKKPKTSRDQLDAMFYVTGKPVRLFQDVAEKDGLELVGLSDLPKALDVYEPGVFEESDNYAGLMGSQARITTVAVPAILAVWGGTYHMTTRSDNLRAFCIGLIQKRNEFIERAKTKSVHSKWLDWRPEQPLGRNWVRHEYMDEALRLFPPK